ncbi:MAG: hypothetical protein AMXMBFR34_07070 [Myxococcaceae bacterium]
MSNRISRDGQQWLSDVVSSNGVLSTDDVSPATRSALRGIGISDGELSRVAGPDGRVDSADEALSLISLVEAHSTDPGQRATVRTALLTEFRSHSVKSLGEADALVLTAAEQKLFRPASVPMTGVDQMSLDPDRSKANTMCFQAAVQQLENSFTSRGQRVPPLDTPSQRIQVALAETTSGRIEADTSAALRARDYIDRCLESGRPALVGVSTVSLAADRHNEGITEHFVTISGRGVDDAGRAFYEFRDPGAGGATGRFYVDPDTGKLFKPGKNLAQLNGRGYAKDFLYELTQVRAYRDMSVDS